MKQRNVLIFLIPIILFAALSIIYETPFIESIDLAAARFITEMRTSAWTFFFVLMSTVGSWHVTAPIWFILVIVFLVKRQGWTVLFLSIVFWGSRQLNWLLKELFSRPRPESDQLVSASHFSFPSGHAMNSMAFYGCLFLLVTLYVNERRLLRRFIHLFLVLLILCIGISRIYVGVHYFTDVLAGYCMGFAWLYGTFRLFRQKL